MAVRSFPITPTFQFSNQGKPLHLQNHNLFSLLHELWRRLGGESATPDLTALESNVNTIFNLLNDIQAALSEVSDRVSQVEIDANSRIDVTNALLASEDNKLYDLIIDAQGAITDNSTNLAYAEQDIDQAQSSVTAVNATITTLQTADDELHNLVMDTQGAITDVSNQLADAEQDIQALDTLTATLASTENIEELLDIVDDMNRALTEISDQAFQATT